MRVSVVIPVYNMQEWVIPAIQSVLNQTCQDFEILVFDDGSTDGTYKAVKSVKDRRIRVFKGKKNEGAGKAYEFMISRAKGKYILPFSADDILEPTFIEKALKGFSKGVLMVACQRAFIGVDGNEYRNELDPRLKIPLAREMSQENWLKTLRGGNLYFGVCMYPKSLFKKIGFFDFNLEWLTDWEFYLRILQHGTFHILEEKLVKLRLHDKALSLITPDKIVRQAKYTRQIRRKFFTPTKQKVIIATPYYMLLAMSPYKRSLMATGRYLTANGIEWDTLDVDGDSYIDRAKNTLVAQFMEGDGTDLLMIDSDMQWPPEAVHRIINHPFEIVGGAFPMKNRWDQFTAWPKVNAEKTGYLGHAISDGSWMLEADFLSGGFLRIKRSALEKFQDHYEELVYIDPTADATCPNRIYTCFFECMRQDFIRRGEDMTFSQRWVDMGEKLYLDTNITFGHYGATGTHGNFHESLMKLGEKNAKEHGT